MIDHKVIRTKRWIACLVGILLAISFLGALFLGAPFWFLMCSILQFGFHIRMPFEPWFMLFMFTPAGICVEYIGLARRRFKAGNLWSSFKITCTLLALNAVCYFVVFLPAILSRHH